MSVEEMDQESKQDSVDPVLQEVMQEDIVSEISDENKKLFHQMDSGLENGSVDYQQYQKVVEDLQRDLRQREHSADINDESVRQNLNSMQQRVAIGKAALRKQAGRNAAKTTQKYQELEQK